MEKAFEEVNGVNFLAAKVPLSDAAAIKTLAFQLTGEHDNAFVLLGSENDGKALLTLAISKGLAGDKLNAGKMIRDLARNIKGGGGGQPFFATAGGKDPSGIDAALSQAKEMVAG